MKINSRNVNKQKRRLQNVKANIKDHLKAIQELLPEEEIGKICTRVKYSYRCRQITPMITLLHMIGAAFSREGTFQSSWQNSGRSRKSDVLCKARKRLPENVWNGVDQWIQRGIDEEFEEAAKWRGHRVIGVDGTAVSMSDEKELVSTFGKSDSRCGPSRFPVARVVIAFTIKTQVAIGHNIGHYKVSEQALLREMLPKMRQGDLIICDRHFAGANLYVEYKDSGVEFITRAHQRLKIENLKQLEQYSDDDFLVELPVIQKHRRENPLLPENVRVRVIRASVKVRGKKEIFWLMTSLLDEKKYPLTEIKDLYKKRWKVETLIGELKIWLNSDVLRSKTAAGVRKEIYARIVASQLIHWLILKAAKKHQKNSERISTTAATRLINAYSYKMSEAPERRLGYLYEQLLDQIAASVIPERPNRTEPRMKRRDQKHYSILHTTREQWRLENVVA